jgi:hypothetical protein
MPVIPVFGRLKQEDHELKARLGYRARPCLILTAPPPTKSKTTNARADGKKQKQSAASILEISLSIAKKFLQGLEEFTSYAQFAGQV